jgi:hypothetical protein
MAVASAHGGRVLFGAALATLVSSALPILLLNDRVDGRLRLEGRGLLVLLYGLGAVFWTAFCVSLAVNGQWSWMRKRPGAFILAALIVSLVYPLQRSLVDGLFRGKVELIADWLPFFISWQVPHAVLAAAWLAPRQTLHSPRGTLAMTGAATS